MSASADDPGVVRVSVRGFNGEYPVAGYFVPLGAVFVAGDWQDGRDGRCGEVRYLPDDCSNDIRRIGCRH